ncbi:MAG TPA: amino acid ABC transporter permease [Casimicrobiaceae bacterium]|jgi:polar amino acid transport system permease protein|nr:amino acid ABC transporter permease [Casimicrobiaceae bacterium]
MGDVAGWFLALYKATGIKLTIFYDGYDRARFIEGFITTVRLSAYCLILSLLLGALVAWFAGSRVAIVRNAVTGFVALFRNTPPLVQLYFFYFALGPLVPKVDGAPLLGSFGWAVVSLTLLETAFAAEIYRAGIEAVPRAMTEAAASLGYSRWQIYRLIMLPLALRATMPAMTNNLVNLVKTTTLAYAIAVPELVYMSAQIWSEQVNVPEMMVVLLVCYVAIVGIINQGMQWLENRLRVPGFGQ